MIDAITVYLVCHIIFICIKPGFSIFNCKIADDENRKVVRIDMTDVAICDLRRQLQLITVLDAFQSFDAIAVVSWIFHIPKKIHQI